MMELDGKAEIDESIPKGYWCSKVGVIPCDWDDISVGEVYTFFATNSLSRDKLDVKSECLNIHYGDIHTRYSTILDIDSEEVPSIVKKYQDSIIKKYESCQNGDIIIADASEDMSDIGKAIELKNINGKKVYAGLHTLHLRDRNKVFSDIFRAYVFYNYDVLTQIRKYAAGAKVLGISKTNIKKVYIPVPPKDEQMKIAEILLMQDRVITLKRRLIEEKKKQKYFLLQILLNHQSRHFLRLEGFGKPWKNTVIDEVVQNKIRRISKPSKGYWRLGLRSHGKGTFHTFVANPEEISMDVLYKVKENDLIVNITFAWEHAIAVAGSHDDDKLVSHRFPTYEFVNDNVPEFFKYFILQKRFKKQLQDISPGGAGRNRVMSKKDFLKLNITIPDPEEQLEIARILSATDAEIKLLNDELEQQIKKKKSLMQLLLTGKVRMTNMS